MLYYGLSPFIAGDGFELTYDTTYGSQGPVDLGFEPTGVERRPAGLPILYPAIGMARFERVTPPSQAECSSQTELHSEKYL